MRLPHDRLAPGVTLAPGLHAVHDVADGEAGLLVDADHRATESTPPTASRPKRYLGVAQAVAHAEPGGHAHHQVGSVRLLLEDGVGAGSATIQLFDLGAAGP